MPSAWWWALLIGHVAPGWVSCLVTGWMFAAAACFGWTCTSFFGMRARRAVPPGFLGVLLGTVVYFIAASFVIGVWFGVAAL